MAQDPDATLADALGELADELLRVGASLAQIVAHLSRWSATAAAAPPEADLPAAVLRRLLGEVVGSELTGHTVTELLDAAGIVGCATDAINRDLFLLEALG